MEVGYVYDPVYLKHDTGQHVENKSRLEAIMAHLEQTGLGKQLTPLKPRAATIEEISQVHHKQYISYIEETAKRGGGWLDPDTVVSSDSYEAALCAAGGTIEAAEAVMSGKVASAFALVRPPGHHATSQHAMGFCLFNNLAIATRYALSKFELERIAIIDFDVHHGNGTQESFYDNPHVLYISTHQSHHYPGTGSIEETGRGTAEGNTLNIPMPAGCSDNEYKQVFTEVIVPAAKRFQPQLIMVSAGYDQHWAERLAFMQVTVTGSAEMVKIIRNLAEETCQGKMVFSLEGGYNLDALAASVGATFNILRGRSIIEDPLGPSPRQLTPPSITSLVKEVKRIHGLT